MDIASLDCGLDREIDIELAALAMSFVFWYLRWLAAETFVEFDVAVEALVVV